MVPKWISALAAVSATSACAIAGDAAAIETSTPPPIRSTWTADMPPTSPPNGRLVVPMAVGDGCAQPAAGCPGQAPAVFTPFMLGDFSGPLANLFADVKVAEGESPMPIDRVFLKTNYYNNLNKSRWENPFEPIHNVDLYRNTFGFEKTFFNQTVSLGLRVPFNTINADGKPVHLISDPNTGQALPSFTDEGFDTTLFGNISAILKAVLWEDRATGDVISAGMTLSLPTASNMKIDPGMSTITFVQPFTGFIFNRGDMFFQGFSSITAPIASAESIVLFNDVGVGYWLLRDGSGIISGLAPTAEFHVATPLRQIDLTDTEIRIRDGLRIFNVVDMTLGATIVFSNRSTWGFGMSVPLTGPKPFDVEAISQFNYRF